MVEESVAVLTSRAAAGDADAASALADTLYGQLRRVAQRQLAGERAGHTLSATALVHEAYLKLAGQDAKPADRAHFLAVAAMAMRRVLVSHARKRDAKKRGGGERPVTLEETVVGGALDLDRMLALEEVLNRLAERSERQARAITCKGFGAMTDAEIAEALGVSVPTVRRDLRVASAFLRKELSA
jgi:RNA polymerase sigma factor (TIGR02999 family)